MPQLLVSCQFCSLGARKPGTKACADTAGGLPDCEQFGKYKASEPNTHAYTCPRTLCVYMLAHSHTHPLLLDTATL